MTNLAIQKKTVSSIELVEIINSAREEGRAVLAHNNFKAKIKKVLGVTSDKFLAVADVKINNGGSKQIPCFYLPKREASLMVMSESYEVQAKVYRCSPTFD
jgi:hypothetical protein